MMDGRGVGDDGGAAGLTAARLLGRVTRQVLGGSGESQCVIGIKVPVKHWAGEKQLDVSTQWGRGEDMRARPCAQEGAIFFILHKNTI